MTSTKKENIKLIEAEIRNYTGWLVEHIRETSGTGEAFLCSEKHDITGSGDDIRILFTVTVRERSRYKADCLHTAQGEAWLTNLDDEPVWLTITKYREKWLNNEPAMAL